MKRIEIDIESPHKCEWEFSIIPDINFGYVSNYTHGRYFIAFGWLLWCVIIIIKKK